jgi:cellulose biosynthesis protein BcsQ
MKKISFHVEKGGTGKTTLTGNVGCELSKYGKTIIVDGDPQGNITNWFVEQDISAELSDVLTGKAKLKDTVVQVRENLYILPTFSIGGNLKEWSETKLFQEPYVFQDLIDDLQNLGFEFCLFDLGPGISNLEKSILSCMDEVIGVIGAEFFSVDGLEIFEHELEQLKKKRRAKFKNNKLVINRYNRSYAYHTAYIENLTQNTEYEFYLIGQSTAISDCVPNHKSLFEYDPGNKWTSEFQKIAKKIIGKVRVK